MAKIFFQKILPIIFFPKNWFFTFGPLEQKHPPKVFFSVHRMMSHTQMNILRIFLKKNEMIKFFRKWEKQKSDLNINSGLHGSKNFNFEGVKLFLGPKNFLRYPILGFLNLKYQKMIFFIKNQNWTSISIHRILAQKIQLWGDQNIIWPHNIFRVPHFKTFDP